MSKGTPSDFLAERARILGHISAVLYEHSEDLRHGTIIAPKEWAAVRKILRQLHGDISASQYRKWPP